MQLVFECSYHTNVDRLHFQSCVPGFCQYRVIVFTSLFFVSDVLNRAALGVQLAVQLPARLFWRQMPVFGCKVKGNMENKNSVIVMLFPCHVML